MYLTTQKQQQQPHKRVMNMFAGYLNTSGWRCSLKYRKTPSFPRNQTGRIIKILKIKYIKKKAANT